MATQTEKKQGTRARRSTGTMTAAHKKALAVGREQGRVIRSYLEALEASRPKRGRKRTAESVRRRDPRHRLPAARRQRDFEFSWKTKRVAVGQGSRRAATARRPNIGRTRPTSGRARLLPSRTR